MWKKVIYWTIEKSIEEAKKYKHKVDFKKNSNRAYNVLRENGLLDEYCKHMTTPLIIKKWNNKNVIEVANLCKSKSEFMNKYSGAYNYAKKHNILDILFKPIGNRYKRCIYAYEFSDNYVYVGLTYNLSKRHYQHMNQENSQVYRHIKDTGIIPKLKQKTDYIDYIESSKMEGYILNEYINNGWIQLNKIKTGGLGNIKIKKEKNKSNKKKINYELVKDCILKCKTKNEFQKRFPSEYMYVIRHKLMGDFEKYFIEVSHKPYTFEECKNEALKYSTKKEFRNNSKCYQVAYKNGWLNDICSHMISGYPKPKYNETIVIEVLKKFSKYSDLRNNDDVFIRGCYWWIKSHKLLNDYKKWLKN